MAKPRKYKEKGERQPILKLGFSLLSVFKHAVFELFFLCRHGVLKRSHLLGGAGETRMCHALLLHVEVGRQHVGNPFSLPIMWGPRIQLRSSGLEQSAYQLGHLAGPGMGL